jgi:flotillin
MTPIVIGFAILLTIIVLISTVKSLIIIVPPNMAAVITGRTRTMVHSDGTTEKVGFRAVIGGRTLRIPIIEEVQWLSLETIPLEINVSNAFSMGNIPLKIIAIANVKIASQPESTFNNAVERLLGKTESEIEALARETLMGNLRGVLAKMTPEEVNEDRLRFATELTEEAEKDLHTLGLQLDVAKIQNVEDDVGYLEAAGRKKTAEVIREARVAEAENEREAKIAEAERQSETREKEASARQRAEVAEAQAAIAIAEAQNELRVRQAELDQQGMSKEKVSRVEAERAEAQAQEELERQRAKTEEQRQRATVIVPAEAEKAAAIQMAEAEAAPIKARGQAQADALKLLFEQISQGGESGMQVFLAEKLPEMLRISAQAVEGIDVERMTIIDGGDGNGLANAANQRILGAARFLESVSGMYGMDVEQLLGSLASRVSPAPDGVVEKTMDRAKDSKAPAGR